MAQKSEISETMPAAVRTVSKKADAEQIAAQPKKRKRLTIRALLRPHAAALALGFLAVLGEAVANLLQPWPLKIVLDEVFKNHAGRSDLPHFVYRFVGADKFATIKFACIAVMAIALLDAISTYGEKYLTTSVGQWVTYDLRRAIYAHIQRLSLAFHDQSRTGDLISRVTTDVDDIQSFIASGLLSSVINLLTLVGMIGVMFWLNWRFTLIALSVAPILFLVVYSYTRCIKKAARGERYYAFRKGEVAFFALDSNYMDPKQLSWLDQNLKESQGTWKICFFHHPLYNDGRHHGPDADLRTQVLPLFQRYGVNAVFSGHEHVYQRIKPENNIYYFVLGNSGKLMTHDFGEARERVKVLILTRASCW